MKKYILSGISICIICVVIWLIYLAMNDMTNRNGTAYVEYEIVYPDSTIHYSDTVNFICCNGDIRGRKKYNLKPIRITSYKGANYIEVYNYRVVQSICPIRLKTSKIINYGE